MCIASPTVRYVRTKNGRDGICLARKRRRPIDVYNDVLVSFGQKIVSVHRSEAAMSMAEMCEAVLRSIVSLSPHPLPEEREGHLSPKLIRPTGGGTNRGLPPMREGGTMAIVMKWYW